MSSLELEPVTGEIEAESPEGQLATEAEARVSETWERLAAAELAGASHRKLEGLEDAYLAEMAACQAALAGTSALTVVGA